MGREALTGTQQSTHLEYQGRSVYRLDLGMVWNSGSLLVVMVMSTRTHA